MQTSFWKNINYENTIWIIGVHIMALVAIPFFTWKAFAVAMFGLFVFAPLGINVGYHRLLAHRAFTAPRWLRYIFVTLGAMAVGGPPLQWISQHRLHHRYSDTEQDPHNSRKGFWWCHILHLFQKNEFDLDEKQWKAYVPDLKDDAYFLFLNKYWIWVAVTVMPVLYYFGGWSFVLWGGFVRVVLCWHAMWFVNSATHMWGYRNYETTDSTTNTWWVGIIAAGEGWHNNHHAHQSSAAHGHKWWEFDFSYLVIVVLEFFGFATDVKRPPCMK